MATTMSTRTCSSGPNPAILLATASMHKRDAARASNTIRKNVHVGACMTWLQVTVKQKPTAPFHAQIPHNRENSSFTDVRNACKANQPSSGFQGNW